jgi:HD-GYP domain-containing protein (c-di-GMP phosphodiesterase class II)
MLNMLTQAIKQRKANIQPRHHLISLTEMLARIMFSVDPFTATHQQRLAKMVCVVGQRLEVSPRKIDWLFFSAMVHDIGKVTIPSAILLKPGKLTDAEYAVMRSHVKRGQEMIKVMELPDYVYDIILNHHERLDGSGYPHGISGEKLSFEARILAACDVVEAMSSPRPYNPVINKGTIIEELQNAKGSKYDSRVTDLLSKMLENGEIVR